MVPDHSQPFHLFFIKFFTCTAVATRDPVLEIAAHGGGVGGKGWSSPLTRQANERYQGGEFANGTIPWVVLQVT